MTQGRGPRSIGARPVGDAIRLGIIDDHEAIRIGVIGAAHLDARTARDPIRGSRCG